MTWTRTGPRSAPTAATWRSNSDATNLVPGDTNATWDIFVYDRYTGGIVRASISSAGQQSNATSQLPSIDHGGGAVAYESDATNLVRPDTNRTTDAYLTLLG